MGDSPTVSGVYFFESLVMFWLDGPLLSGAASFGVASGTDEEGNSGPLPPPSSAEVTALTNDLTRERLRAAYRWNVPKRLTAVAIFGGIDLSYADFTSADMEIHSYSIFGGQTIVVLPEVNVDLDGVGVMGSFDNSIIGAEAPGASHTLRPAALAVEQRRREALEAPGGVR